MHIKPKKKAITIEEILKRIHLLESEIQHLRNISIPSCPLPHYPSVPMPSWHNPWWNNPNIRMQV